MWNTDDEAGTLESKAGDTGGGTLEFKAAKEKTAKENRRNWSGLWLVCGLGNKNCSTKIGITNF